MQNIPTKVDGVSTLPAAEFNQIPDELENAILNTGQTLTSSNLNQSSIAMSIYASGGDFYTDSGAADAYVLTAIGSKKAPIAYFNGMRVRFLPGNVNTGASTINVATLGSKNIKQADGSTDPTAGDIPASSEIQLTYDGTNFRITSTSIPKVDFPATVATDTGKILVVNAAGDNYELLATNGTAGLVLTSNGVDTLPTYQSVAAGLIDTIYPVGSIYYNKTDATNPGTLLGTGTWVAITDRFIVSRGSTYTATGGAATVSLSSANNAAHTHVQNAPNPTGGSDDMPAVDPGADNSGSNATLTSTASSGSGSAFSIIPPYQAVYTWERTV